MEQIYLFCMVASGILILLTVFQGISSSVDMVENIDAEHSFDVTHDHSHEMPAWIPFFSLRFWLYSAFLFGISGYVTPMLYVIDNKQLLYISIVFGFTGGWIIHLLMNKLHLNSSSSHESILALVGKDARVILHCSNKEYGKISVQTATDRIHLLAYSEEESIKENEAVIIVQIKDNIAIVKKKQN